MTHQRSVRVARIRPEPRCSHFKELANATATLLAVVMMVCIGETAAHGQTPVVRDTFTDANGVTLSAHAPDVSVGSGWALWGPGCCAPTPADFRQPSANVQDGRAALTNGDNAWFVGATLDTGRTEGTVGVDWIAGSGAQTWGGLMLRYTDAINFILVRYWSAEGLVVHRMQNGALTTLGSLAMPAVPGGERHRLTAVLNGPSIFVLWDGVLKLQVTDSFQQSSTRHGIAWHPVVDATARYDAFEVTPAAAIVRDTFSDANGVNLPLHAPDLSPGGAWTLSGPACCAPTPGDFRSPTARVQGGQAALTNGDNAWFAGATLETGRAEGTVSVDWIAGNSPQTWGGLMLRYTDAINFILVRYWSAEGLVVHRMQNGALTTLGSLAMPAVPPGERHRLAAVLHGSSISVLWDGVLKLQVIDSFQQTSTRHGLAWHPVVDPAARYDTFEVAPTVAIVRDTFTDTSGVTLPLHVPELSAGGAWTLWGPACCAPTAADFRSPTARVQDGQAALTSGDGAWFAGATLQTLRSDGTVSVDWIAGTGAQRWGGLMLRYTNAINFILVRYWSAEGLVVHRMQNGALSTLGSLAMPPVPAGERHRLSAVLNGPSISVFWDGALTLQVTDSFQQTSTQHGIAWHPVVDPTARYDDFEFSGGQSPASNQPCTYSVSPLEISAAREGGAYSFQLTAPSGCEWAVTNGVSWLAVEPWVGQGSATLTVSVAPSPESYLRGASFTVAGYAVAVRQAGSGTGGGGSDTGSDEAGILYYHTDAIGSVRLVTGREGQEVERIDYLPFGGELTAPGSDNQIRFAGKERDIETTGLADSRALNYFGARYYQSQTGRFTTVDPGHVGGDIFNPQSWNGYAYALNNPLRFVDPLGMEACEITLRGADAAAAGVADGGTVQGECVRPKESWSDWFGRNFLDLVPFTARLQAPGLGEADQPLADRSPDAAVSLAAGIMLPTVAAKRSTALLTQAAMTVGNRGAVAASRDVALQAAEEWVGIGARLIRSRSGQVIGKISADGQRVYRTTSLNKSQPYVNLENKATGGNLHIRW